jgi:hypothetical protein
MRKKGNHYIPNFVCLSGAEIARAGRDQFSVIPAKKRHFGENQGMKRKKKMPVVVVATRQKRNERREFL